ncbi:MAG: AMP-binding protein [Polyangiaceae bacterium]|jgi:fatty-acyl-CoA synthase|nr:AMP-binding protein [Polyangiaceae bacterium]
MFVGDWAARGASYWPDRVAVVDVAKGERGRFTYAELGARAERLAAWLRDEAGVGVGDRVGLLAHNGVEYLDALFACGKLGAVFVPYNWRLHSRETAELVARTAPKALLFDDACAEAAAALPPAPGRRLVHLEARGLPGSVSYADVLAAPAPAAPLTHEPVDPERIFCLLFTGGTTGLPKAARISYRMAAWNALNTLVHELRPGDVTVTHTPMFHTGGLLVYTLPLLSSGGRVIIMRRWDAGEMLRLVGQERVSLFFCVPSQALDLAQHPDFARADLAGVRFITTGGAPMPVPLLRAWQAAHQVPFKQGFGMTECGPGIFSMPAERAAEKAGSIGRPNYFIDARLVDDEGRPVPAGAEGELCLRGPSLCSGYYGEEGAFADAEGWFRSGDLMRTDDDGYYYVVGRKKDMFISGGENVYPVEIEQALAEHPAVAACAVIGVPHVKWGEVGHAFLAPRPGAEVPAGEELAAFLKARLASYKVPKAFSALPELPLTAAGKIDKNELRRRAAEPAASAAPGDTS